MSYIADMRLLSLAFCCIAVQVYGQQFDLIPYPEHLVPGKGYFVVHGGNPDVRLVHDPSIASPEGYKLHITPDEVVLSASTETGIFYGRQTIRQLTDHGRLPAVDIEDAPAYAWRGMHLDVARHFFSIAYLKRLIDLMAYYKMNKLHLHLSDDQGWRVEIKRYPLLTESGAWRTFDHNDSACMRRATDNPDFALDSSHIIRRDGKTLYGGFYTQEDLKDLVAYAAARHVDIIPEIDMPGHMMAAINAYPWLTCNGDNSWGALFTKPICPCNDSTIAFAENVYSEIMNIFPSEYIHIGGDEVDRSDWAKSPACKALMADRGIKDLAGLQSYFIDTMEAFFHSKGRKLIGWDEILEGGISPSAAVMYWRSWVPNAPVRAAENGNPVVMAPGDPLYFDGIPDKNSLDRVYHFNPVPGRLNAEQARCILGAQACVWTENIPSEARADYMMMPRMTALAEDLWTRRPELYRSYLQRLQAQYPVLDRMGVHYRLPDLPDMVGENVFVTRDTLRVKAPLRGMIIRYTTDSTPPGPGSAVLPARLLIDRPETVRLAAFRDNGERGDVYTLHYRRQAYAPPASLKGLAHGLYCTYYRSAFRSTADMEHARPDSTFAVDTIAATENAPAFGLRFRGYLDAPETGVYTFYLTSDDGSRLSVAGRATVDNDGLHSAQERDGQVALARGLHVFALDFIEGGGGYTLRLLYSVNGSEPKPLPRAWLLRDEAPEPYGVLPTERQLRWQETEMYCLVHFSMATFTDKEWGEGDEDPSIFDPKHFSARQIVGAAKAGGFKGIVVVAKHHDGFCLWPTATTPHNITASPYKHDMVRAYEVACREMGMKMGIYCSPWDRNNPLYGEPEYVTRVYRRQLEELETHYGPLFLVWHDGANGGSGYYGGARETRRIDRSTYYGWDSTWGITRRLQPGACIFGDVGPDVRWVGNEQGHAGETCWETYTPESPEPGKAPANGFDRSELATDGTRNGDYWMPAECDVPLRPGWFYHASDEGKSKSPSDLMDLYFQSVGRGACLDLGLSPDKDGVLDTGDVRILAAFGDLLHRTFDRNLAEGAVATASNVRDRNAGRFGPARVLDGDRYTYWATDDSVTRPWLVLTLPVSRTFNVIRLREDIRLGQRIDSVALDAWMDGMWRPVAGATSIGANRLIRLEHAVTTNKVRLRIAGSPVCIALSDFALFSEPGQGVRSRAAQ